MDQPGLAARFEERRSWSAHRASCVFPVRTGGGRDTLAVFLDYWQLKKRLPPVTVALRVMDPDGRIVHAERRGITAAHNEISLAGVLGTFEGMAELEVFSERDMAFPIPAVTVFFRSGERYSAVHARGRVLNPDEEVRPTTSIETNWPCKRGPGITPFFHLFNGPRAGGLGEVPVRLMRSSTDVIAERTIRAGDCPPYWSRLVALDELFGQLPDEEYFVAVPLPHAEFFPGTIAGNLHRREDVLEATHTFYWTTQPEYVEAGGEVDLPSFVPLMMVPELDLEIVSFPTNAPAELRGSVRRATGTGPLEETGEPLAWRTGGEDARPWRHRVAAGAGFECLDLRDGAIPSRLNATYEYTVRGTTSPYSTATAWGAYAHLYPPRRSHWGHGLVARDLETAVLVRNVSHRGAGREARCAFTLHRASGAPVSREVVVGPQSAACVRLSELMPRGNEVESVSWLVRSDNPDLDTYWVSFGPRTICGDHGF
jgi:hypothetical protein